ncbi:hypothetical protein BD309DRAFT_220815 [Dichomitus squalens]|nr:hypothetical protein BD309DRAFT_220815 [Dichomitus squalens]
MGETITRIGTEQSTPGRFLVDALHILQYLPSWFLGMGFKAKAAAWKEQAASHRDRMFDAGVETLAPPMIRCLAVSLEGRSTQSA